MSSLKVLVTGANGFVGEALVFQLLLNRSFNPIAAVRGQSRLQGLCPVVAFDLTDIKTLPVLGGVQVVVHAAARVHVMNELAVDALGEFRRVNVEGTLKLARHAAKQGVKRFIFISSIKVNGESTVPGVPFDADNLAAPLDPYSISKYEAEEGLRQISLSTGMEVVIIRPPLVYGPGVRANFLSLLRWVEKGIPLPFGAIDNRRSLVAIDNLVGLIIECIKNPAASGNIFLASDGDDLSSAQLVCRMAEALNRKVYLLSVPKWLLELLAAAAGRKSVASRLFSSLQVSILKNHEVLGWTPSVSIDVVMRRVANHYLETQGKG